MSTIPYQKMYRAEATSKVLCKGERKPRPIRILIPLTEQLFNLSDESLDQYVRFAYIHDVGGKHMGTDVHYYKQVGYLIDGIEYWSE